VPAGVAAAAALYLIVGAPANGAKPPVAEILDAHGHVERVVAAPSTFSGLVGARWSPSRRQLAWSDETGVTVENADGSGEHVLIPRPACDNDQCLGGMDWSWAPDGTRIAAGGGGHWTNLLQVADVATGAVTTIVRPQRYTDYARVSWSPNGRRVAYLKEWGHAGTASCCHAALVVSRPDGTHARTLYTAHDGLKDGPLPTWSPDSRTIAFTTQRFDLRDPTLATVDVATGKVKAIDAGAYASNVVWSPGGRRFAVRTSRGVVTMAPDGSHRRTLATDANVFAWTRGTGLLLAKTFDTARSVWISRDGLAPARPAFRVPGGLSLFSIDPSR
jgi:dipeptidyl aminopeptidase/acylaminoacyl peptidase